MHSNGLRQRRKGHEKVAEERDEVDCGEERVLPLQQRSGRHNRAARRRLSAAAIAVAHPAEGEGGEED